MRRKNHQKKEEIVYLSAKGRIMLNMLLRNGRISNTAIARRLNISSQVTGRIRRSLERDDVIKNYSIEIDPEVLDINTFVLIFFKLEPNNEEKVMSDNMTGLYKILGNQITHIGTYAFQNVEKAQDYMHSLIEHSNGVKIIKTCISSRKNMLKCSSKNVFYNAINGFKNNPGIYPSSIIQKLKKKKSLSLSISEKEVLKELVKNSRISCKKIASHIDKLKITRTGVHRIEKRLENQGVIKRYDVNLDYGKLGVNILAFFVLTIKPEALIARDNLLKNIDKSCNLIGCCESDDESIVLSGFRNLSELESYCDNKLKTIYKDFVELKDIFIFTPKGIIKESFADLYLSLLE